MKLIFIFTCTLLINVTASVYSQNTQFTFSVEGKTIKDVFRLIEKESQFRFLYNDDFTDLNRTVTIDVKSNKVEDILNKMLNQSEITYHIMDNNLIVITPVGLVQGIRITGVVSDKGEPLPGVNVTVKGTLTGVVTDVNGKYSINVPGKDAVLVFSFVGYVTQELVAGDQTTMDIVLNEDTRQIEEVVVIGYGVQKKTNITGSVTVLESEKLENRPITNSTQALQGLPGIYVNQAGGQPGVDGATIRIRGVGSIGGTSKLNPLVLVDGVEYPLGDVNPSDIESISVLKDAASTAIYGSRAANGIILVTTRLGSKERMSIDYNNYFGVQKATFLPDPVSNSADFMEAWNTAWENEGRTGPYLQAEIDEYRNSPTNQWTPNTNWMDICFRNAFIQEHNLRFSGGTEKTRYNVSGGYLDQEGIMIGSGSKRYSGNLRVSSDLNKRITIEAGVSANRLDIDHLAYGTGDVMNRLFRLAPVMPIGRLPDGTWPYHRTVTPSQNAFENPQILAEDFSRNQIIDRVMLNFNFKLKLMEGLTYDLRASATERKSRTKIWYPKMNQSAVGPGARSYNWRSTAQLWDQRNQDSKIAVTNLLTYQKTIKNDHAIVAMLGTSMEKFDYDELNASKTDFPSNDLQENNTGTVMNSITGTSYGDALLSFFGRIQYAYRDKYLLEVNGRYDGSSRFAAENRWGFFPSFSAGWRISEESFMKDIDWIDALKIRVSWGQIGMQEIGRFQYVNSIVLANMGYAFGGIYQAGAAATGMKDPKISWETTTMTNFGLDWRLFKGLLSGEFEVFHKRTDGILRTVTLPSQIGALTGPVSNVAVVDNTGFEITIQHNNQIGDFSYQIGGTLTKIKNEVVDMKDEVLYEGNRVTKKGEAIGSWYILQTDGLFRTQADLDNTKAKYSTRVGLGDVKYVDRKKDDIIDADDRYIAGNSFPEFTYGFNIGAGYKNFSLTTLWQGVQNISVFLGGNLIMPFNNGAGLQKEWLTDAWTPQNPDARLPRLTAFSTYKENFAVSDMWLKDVSYLRLKNIQLAYDVPNMGFLNKVGIKKLKLFVNAQNLLTITNIKDFDPEQDVTVESLNKYPSVKMFTGGLNISF